MLNVLESIKVAEFMHIRQETSWWSAVCFEYIKSITRKIFILNDKPMASGREKIAQGRGIDTNDQVAWGTLLTVVSTDISWTVSTDR